MSSEAPLRAGDRLSIVDGVRLLSILVVFAVHLASSGQPRLSADAAGGEAWLYFARNGSYGVTLFFVVSGFVITRTIVRRTPDLARLDVGAFYARRAGRILPLFLLTVGLGIVALAGLAPETEAVRFCFRRPEAHFDSWFWSSLATFSFNWLRILRERDAYGFGLHWDVLWSLAIEEQFYLLYPLVLRGLGTRRRLSAFLGLVVVLGPLSRAWAGASRPQSFLLAYTNSFAAFEQIALGALLCLLVERCGPSTARGVRGALQAAAGILGAVGVAVVYRFSSLESAPDRVWGPSAIAVALCLFLFMGIRRSWLESSLARRLTDLGQWSYGGYLLHAAVLFTLWPVVGQLGPWSGFLVFAASTLAVSALVHRALEVPSNAAIRRWFRA